MINKIITYIYTFLFYSKKFGFLNSCKLFISRDFYIFKERSLFGFKPNGWNHSVFFRRNNSDFTVFQQVFMDRQYNFKLPFEPKTIVDCGANIGMASLYFFQQYPLAKIIAVEPDKDNVEQMKMNLQGVNFIPVHGGIWNKSALLEVKDTFNAGSWGFICSEISSYQAGCVNAYSIGDIMANYNLDEIDLLKIDIEGAEVEVFSSNYESWLPKTKCIMIELHDFTRKGCSRIFFETLFKYDFSIYIKGEGLICLRNN